jgi:mono/diheme cytochrome c family protein
LLHPHKDFRGTLTGQSPCSPAVADIETGTRREQLSLQEQSNMQRASITLAVIIVLALSAVASAQEKTQVERGMKVYGEQKCAICHAIEGKGNAKGRLDGVGTKLKIEEIRAWLVTPAEMAKKTQAERKPPMKAYATLSKEDLDALVAYMASLN